MLESVTPGIYRARNLVERLINKLKRFRRVATRYDKDARSCLAAVTLAAIRLRAKFESTTWSRPPSANTTEKRGGALADGVEADSQAPATRLRPGRSSSGKARPVEPNPDMLEDRRSRIVAAADITAFALERGPPYMALGAAREAARSALLALAAGARRLAGPEIELLREVVAAPPRHLAGRAAERVAMIRATLSVANRVFPQSRLAPAWLLPPLLRLAVPSLSRRATREADMDRSSRVERSSSPTESICARPSRRGTLATVAA